jgi:putative thioredoxin
MEFLLNANQPAGPGKDPAAPAAADVIKDATTKTFMKDVIEASLKVPVIVDFWAPWCGPCKQLGPILEKLVRQAAGMVRLVKINVDENQDIAAQMRVQSIPMVYAFKGGQPVDGFAGALPESQVKLFIDRLTGGAKAPLDLALDDAKAALEAGDASGAAAIYAQVLAQDSTNPAAVGGLIRAAVASGDVKRAKQVANGLSEKMRSMPEIAAGLAALELAEQTAESGDVGALMEKVAHSPNDLQARFELALALYGRGRNEAAVEQLLDLVKRDRKWNDEAARKQLVKIFEALGPTDPITVSGRRQLSSILFS